MMSQYEMPVEGHRGERFGLSIFPWFWRAAIPSGSDRPRIPRSHDSLTWSAQDSMSPNDLPWKKVYFLSIAEKCVVDSDGDSYLTPRVQMDAARS